ncbi:MAG: excinuclease ABC subunit UvrC [Bacteroidales bacterium]|jgi:excinuclease ABC subunit C|nr:excinuclease ABC subunit UvrC [Bacteroidales bacterium]
MERASELIKNIIKSLPSKPGVYQYFDKNGEIIYIGKARNLKKRVSSYFNKKHDSARIELLVRKINDIKSISVATENDALLLENVLIKKYQPRYNIMLKDDKTYPWICISAEPFPRIFLTRNVIKNGSDYFGPYSSVRTANVLMDLIHHLYPLRSCKLHLSPEKVRAKKVKICLEYYIGNCAAPCENLQTQEEYLIMVGNIREIIKGNVKIVLSALKEEMMRYADELNFEEAQIVKKKYDLLKQYQSRSVVVNPSLTNVDVFTISVSPTEAFVNFMKIIDGAVVQSRMLELKKRLDETPEELLGMAIVELRQQNQSTAKEVIVPFLPDALLNEVSYAVPKRGDKAKLLELSERNARMHRMEREKMQKLLDPELHAKRILAIMQHDLRMNVPPEHIECFDNSNIQGSYPVAAMVVFRNAKASKKEYRHFNIKTVEGPNDFASMEEAIYRRYSRLLEENKELPQLIIVDGGKGQLSSAMKSLEKLDLRGKITIIGIAKRLEEIYYPDDSLPMYIDKASPTLKVIQQLRDEAHRFGITHHRNRRSKGSLHSELDVIPGIGEKTKELLLKKGGSLKRIKSMSLEELSAIVGKSKATMLQKHFSKGLISFDS